MVEGLPSNGRWSRTRHSKYALAAWAPRPAGPSQSAWSPGRAFRTVFPIYTRAAEKLGGPAPTCTKLRARPRRLPLQSRSWPALFVPWQWLPLGVGGGALWRIP